ncbi:uncharacterized protein G2W53_034159 [Senna tora]|uniref:Uncharacterized protein n=1 Tax=Senna tora TaxID=362788 RepID=A0A834W993_9FABA|nr:uncharacterized protein G2W53_034159 [Senna tora]
MQLTAVYKTAAKSSVARVLTAVLQTAVKFAAVFRTAVKFAAVFRTTVKFAAVLVKI